MSIVHCDYCDKNIDTDYDAEHFVDGTENCLKQVEDASVKIEGIVIEKGALGNDCKVDLNGITFHSNIPVNLNFSPEKIVGKAKAYIEDGVLKADLIIDKKQAYDLLYPAVQIQSVANRGNVITKSKLMSIGLCTSNADPTIKTIGKQNKKATE